MLNKVSCIIGFTIYVLILAFAFPGSGNDAGADYENVGWYADY